MTSSTTLSSFSPRLSNMVPSFSAWGIVRGKPSKTNLDQTNERTKKYNAGKCSSPVLASLVVFELVLDHVDHDVVVDELARIDDLLRHLAELSLFSNLLAEKVARREMANTELISYFRRLRALSCPRQSQYIFRPLACHGSSTGKRTHRHRADQLG